MRNLNENTALNLKETQNKLLKKSLISNDSIEKFMILMGIDKKNISTFMNYEPSVSGEELANSGLKGGELGKKRAEMEKKLFIQLRDGL